MPKEKIAFIINPHSGRNTPTDTVDLINKYLDSDRFSPVFYKTEYRGHAKSLAYLAANEGCKILVAVGGDGTVNEVASANVMLQMPLGIIPTGSGNGLARHLQIPISVSKALGIINQNSIQNIDAGKINDFWFFCTCGVGFDAKIGFKFSKINQRGFLGYLKTIVKEFRRYNIKKYRFKVDDKKYVRKAFLITIANASQYGNNAFIAPDARIDDGLLDICIVKPFPRWKVFFLAFRLMRGSINQSKYYEFMRGKTVSFKKPKKKYVLHFDGEPIKFKKEKIQIDIVPKILPVIIPANTK